MRRLVQKLLRSLARGLRVLPLVIPMVLPLAHPWGAHAAQQTAQTPALIQGSPKGTKKFAPKIWTNDDFPPAPVLQPIVPRAEGVEQPKQADTPAPDPEREKLLKMTPKERQEMIESDKVDISYAQEKIDNLRDDVTKEPDDDKYKAILKKIDNLRKGQDVSRRELEILRKLPPPPTQKNDSEKAPTNPPATNDTKTKPESGPPSNQS